MAKKNEIVKKDAFGEIEQVLVTGDLKELSPGQRIEFYNGVCNSLGLNPLTKPFEYIVLDGRLTLYANKNCAEQLRKNNGVSIDDVSISRDGDTIRVLVKGHDKTGRTDAELGVVSLVDRYGKKLFGDRLANAEMKALTKAKRRLTLSLCGLGMLDETELDTIEPERVCKVEVVDGEVKDLPEGSTAEQSKPAASVKDDEIDIDSQDIPICVCGGVMSVKCSENGHCFWGCVNYPDCKEVVDIAPPDYDGSTTQYMRKSSWLIAVAMNDGDEEKAKKMLAEKYNITFGKKLTNGQVGHLYNAILQDYLLF